MMLRTGAVNEDKNSVRSIKLIFLISVQNSKYSVFYELFGNLFKELTNLRADFTILLIKDRQSHYEIPIDFRAEIINGDRLLDYIALNNSDSTVFVTVDSTYILNKLYRVIGQVKILVWAHYFFGHRFIFSRYNSIDSFFKIGLKRRYALRFSEFVPFIIIKIISHKYISTLKHSTIISQSIWTDLLLERVYSIRTKGILHIPVDPEAYYVNTKKREPTILIFLGNPFETDLHALNTALLSIQEVLRIKAIDFFGSEETGKIFQQRFTINLRFLGKLERKDLAEEFRSHFLTITPIYNGNFEMVPIESLLCGTPVVSFIQPFMEVTGQSPMISNILSCAEIKAKVKMWEQLELSTIEQERKKILAVMDKRKVAEQLRDYIHMLYG